MAHAKPFQLYPFQKRVLTSIMQGKNVIVQAPTGSGKTKAALIPFLQNLARQGSALPLTCRYAVPLRVLANQFYREYESILGGIDTYTPTRLQEKYRQVVAVQTGEQPDDVQFEAPLTFCTIDQLFASFLAIPYGMGSNRANLNVGGVVGSYLVLDEFHLYPLLREGKSVLGARTTTIVMLRLLKSITPFVLMTATFSTSLLKRLESLLDAQVVTVSEEELQEISQGRSRTFWRSLTEMNAQAILAQHRQRTANRCTLVVCNTVGRAQKLFLEWKQAEASGTRVVLLHSRFSVEDRRRLAEEIEHELGPQQWRDGIYRGRDIIVVATQVVEVGLNISVEVLHTELAPANSLIQRAGRCARFEQQQGRVIVYPPPLDEERKRINTLPYDGETCETTWMALERFDGCPVGFFEEQQLIDAVHTQEDEALLERFDLSEEEILNKIFESLNSNDRSVSSTLIRDFSQVQILIHDDPNTAITEAPWRWQSFSMHPASLSNPKIWAALQEKGKDLEWVCMMAEPVTEANGTEDVDNRQQTRYTWKPVTNPAQIRQALFLVLPSQLGRYDAELGFVLLDGQLPVSPNGYQSELLPESVPDYERKGSQQTSYQDHIRGLVDAYNQGLSEDIAFVASRLEREMGLSHGIVDQAIRLAIACHDLGKLNHRWQQWALAWQTLLFEQLRRPPYQLPSPTFCFAKTDNNYSRQYREWQRDVQPKRPHHACESVAIGRNLIGMSLLATKTTPELLAVLRAICGAIARHHTSQASEHEPVVLSSHALLAAHEALHIAHQGATWSYNPAYLRSSITKGANLAPTSDPQPQLTRPDWRAGRLGELESWLYFVIVRALRLADQRAG